MRFVMQSTKRTIICVIQGLIIATIFFIPNGLTKDLFASSQVIQRVEAGPEKVPKKEVGHVKTNFMWNKPGNACRCGENQGPCIETFLNKGVARPQRFPSRIEDYYIQNNMGSEYQGAGQVPWGVDVASVRLINIPFCGQERRGKQNPSTK